jgi:protein-disulfide isomerase
MEMLSNEAMLGKRLSLSVTQILAWCALVAISACCEAQNSSIATQLAPHTKLHRRIEVMLRSQFNIPADVDVSFGATAKSNIPGFQELPITFSRDGKSSTENFLLSDNGDTIARLEKVDISRSPADKISIQNRPVRGSSNAKVTVVMFDDLECPYCAQMHTVLSSETAAHYKGMVRFIYEDYPLEGHPWATHAAVDANCLASQNGDAYWNFVDYVHSHAEEISKGTRDVQTIFKTLDILAYTEGQRSKLDLVKLGSCTAKQDESEVRASIKQGDELNVDRTPTLFVNGERVAGVPVQLLWIAIDRALRDEGVESHAENITAARK